MRKSWIAVVVAMLVVAPVGAVETVAAKPEEVAQQMLALTRAGDWTGYAELLHPEALVAFQRMFREIVAGDASHEAGKQLFGVADLAAFDALPASEVFQRMMATLTKIPQFAAALASAEGVIVGSVAEGSDLVHVVFRLSASAESLTFSRVSAMTLRKFDGQWRALLSGNIEGIAAALAARAPAAAP